MPGDRWADATAYDRFMGRWSRALARDFVAWLGMPPGASWFEIGCGTGALTAAICELGEPGAVLACDTAPDFVRTCRERLDHPALTVVAAEPERIPPGAAGHDVVVSSLVLNFLPDPVRALTEMRDACVPGGRVAACVWDYAEGMELLRIFWDAAVALDPAARGLHEGFRFPLCRPEALRDAFAAAGLGAVDVAAITVPTEFESFADYWEPFVAGPGPAPTYVSALTAAARRRLADRLRADLAARGGDRIRLRARAWAVRGRVG